MEGKTFFQLRPRRWTGSKEGHKMMLVSHYWRGEAFGNRTTQFLLRPLDDKKHHNHCRLVSSTSNNNSNSQTKEKNALEEEEA
jgi:hypothetical protein